MNNNTAIPSWYKTVAIIAVIWNIMGVIAFSGHVMMSPEAIATLPAAEQELYQNIPVWVTIAFAIAVFAGLLGSIALLLRKPLALPLLISSLVGIIIQDTYSFLFTNTIKIYGNSVLIMPSVVIVIAVFLIWLANKAKNNHWLDH
ncbi:hypothetical protein [Thalassotalea piscium]|uniref:Magnesium-transporting ATPase (P-type) n=1 Tax=Thalassotalea piscium TaxID=1230533 RepID=A0A7X0NJR3_9GAMM|nr:hypothetical protein [Thalassotalea piscium]MBB6544581.1 magnesium-transporting ATPase (P-type) [Thalassotalea piscium]